MIIAFEGIDGSGKSTLAKMFGDRLRQEGIEVQETRPSGEERSRIANQIREITRNKSNIALTPVPEFLLFMARYIQQINEMAERKADVIIADRCLYTPVLQAVARETLSFDEAFEIANRCALGIKWPDIVVLINVDIETSRIRKRLAKIAEKRLGEGRRKGTAGHGLRVRLHRACLELAERNPENFIVIDNSSPTLEPAFHQLLSKLLPKLGIEPKDESLPKGYRAPQWRSLEEVPNNFFREVRRLVEVSPRLAALCLKGLNSDEAWSLRNGLKENVEALDVVAYSLSGLSSARARAMRIELKDKVPYYVLHSLPSWLAEEEDIRLRRSLAVHSPFEVGLTLKRWDTDWAWDIRKELEKISQRACLVSLSWIDTDAAWKIRYASKKKDIPILLRSLNGVDSESAWEIRMRHVKKFPAEVVRSTAGIGSQQAHDLRERFIERAPDTVMKSISNLLDEKEMDLRERAARHSRVAIGSLFECDHESAWKLREDYLELWPVAAVASLGVLWKSERGRGLIEKALKTSPSSLKLARAITRYLEAEN